MKKIRVLQFICPTGYYGAERWITALVKELDHEYIDTQLCITNESNSATDIIVHCKPYCEKVHQLDMSSKFDLRVITHLVSLLKREKIDIIHTHGYKSDIVGIIAGKIAGIKTICTPHGFENTNELKLRAFIWLGARTFNYFDRVCPLSPQIEQDLLNRYHVNPKKIKQIKNGVDLSEIHEALKVYPEDIPNEYFTVGYIGQLISRKNMTAMILAFSILEKQISNVKLVIIGDGEERNSLENLCKELSIDSKVSFLGFLDDRLKLLPTFDTFALTSSLEGIPRCLMEAMAANVCVTAFDIPGVDQLIQNGETGMSCRYNDNKALADIWLKLAQDIDYRKTLASNGRQFIHQSFSANAMAKNYHELYSELILQGPNLV